MIVAGVEVPDIDLTKKEKVDLSKDARTFSGLEEPMEFMDGPPVIRRSLANAVNNKMAAGATKEQPAYSGEERFMASFTEEEKVLYDEYSKVVEQFPAGITPAKLIELRRVHNDLYLIMLASGPYLYRALTAREDKRIREIKGLLQSSYVNHVISTCVIAPAFTLLEADSSKLAGTKNTLYEQILIHSDFATNDTASMKL